MPTLSRYTEDTQLPAVESPGCIVGNREPLVERVRSGSTSGSHFKCGGCKHSSPPTVTLLWWDTPHVKAALAEKAKLLSEFNKALAKDLQARANLAATENCTVEGSIYFLCLSAALHVSIYNCSLKMLQGSPSLDYRLCFQSVTQTKVSFF